MENDFLGLFLTDNDSKPLAGLFFVPMRLLIESTTFIIFYNFYENAFDNAQRDSKEFIMIFIPQFSRN